MRSIGQYFDTSKTNISKFQFDLDYCQALYHEPLAREITQALPVLLTLNKLFIYYFTLRTEVDQIPEVDIRKI